MILKNELDITKAQLKEAEDVISNLIITIYIESLKREQEEHTCKVDSSQEISTLKDQIKALQEELENERENNKSRESNGNSSEPIHKSIGKPPVKKLIVSPKK